ncbi:MULTISPECIES: MFS transporter [unclassified Streptomyces]|uniref:MFS transporter n=1 Tax=unclassified Streptomyces TaxID=2593676 RepID=UPI00278C40EC|nr:MULTISPECIES: MFS transporter [unclassified Streptomyces]
MGTVLALFRALAWVLCVGEGLLSVVAAPLVHDEVRREVSEKLALRDMSGFDRAPLVAVCALVVAVLCQLGLRRVDLVLVLRIGGTAQDAVAPTAVPEVPELGVAAGVPPEFGRPRRRPNPWFGQLCRVGGVLLNLAAVAGYLKALWELAGLVVGVQFLDEFGWGELGQCAAWVIGARIAQVLAPRLLRHGRRHRVVLPSSLADCLSRPYALYLRPFDKDGVIADQPVGLDSRPHYVNTTGSTLTVEEMLSGTLAPAGRLIAVGHPEDELPPPGAARVYLPWDNWEPTVLALMERAGLVVLGTGPARGTLWEFGQAVRRCAPARLVVLVYSDPAEYAVFRTVADRLLPAGRHLPDLPEPARPRRWIGGYPLKGLIVFDDDWRPTLLPVDLAVTRTRIRGRLNEDVRLQLWTLFQRALGRLGLRPPPATAITRRKRYRALTAMLTGICVHGLAYGAFTGWSSQLGSDGAGAGLLAGPWFVLDPVGALLVGAVADRWGRRPAALLTASVMGLAPLALAPDPDPGSAVAMAGVLIAFSCFTLAYGGDFALGAVLLAESARPGRRATLLGCYLLGVYLIHAVLEGASTDLYEGAGRGVVLSVVVALTAVALWLRRGLTEPRGPRQFAAPERGLFEALRRHRGATAAVLLAGLALEFGLYAMGSAPADIPSGVLDLSTNQTFALYGLLLLTLPLFGLLADRLPRGTLLVACCAGLTLVRAAEAAASNGPGALATSLHWADALLVVGCAPALVDALVGAVPARVRAVGVGLPFVAATSFTGPVVGVHDEFFDVLGKDWVFPLAIALLYAVVTVWAIRGARAARGGHEVLDR